MAIPLGLTGAARTRAIIEERRRVEQTESSGTGTGGNGGGSGGTGTNKTPTLSRDLRLSMSEMSKKIGNLAQTNYYHIQLTLPTSLEKHFKTSYSKDPALKNVQNFVSNRLGYLCSDATLPVSSYATAEVKDNFMGVPQEFAHTRLYTDIDLTFYIDDDYTVLRFFEGWMDYVGGGNSAGDKKNGIPAEPAIGTSNKPNAYRRFNWPDDYKVQTLNIIKFERNIKSKLVYNFINAFPKGLTAVPVSYGPADLLKVTVTFNFDRYILEREAVAAEVASTSDTKKPLVKPVDEGKGPPTAKRFLGNSQEELDRLYWAGYRGEIKSASGN